MSNTSSHFIFVALGHAVAWRCRNCVCRVGSTPDGSRRRGAACMKQLGYGSQQLARSWSRSNKAVTEAKYKQIHKGHQRLLQHARGQDGEERVEGEVQPQSFQPCILGPWSALQAVVRKTGFVLSGHQGTGLPGLKPMLTEVLRSVAVLAGNPKTWLVRFIFASVDGLFHCVSSCVRPQGICSRCDGQQDVSGVPCRQVSGLCCPSYCFVAHTLSSFHTRTHQAVCHSQAKRWGQSCACDLRHWQWRGAHDRWNGQAQQRVCMPSRCTDAWLCAWHPRASCMIEEISWCKYCKTVEPNCRISLGYGCM